MEASWFREHRFLCLSLLVVLLGLLMLEAACRADHFPEQVDQVTVDGARACIYLTYTDDAGMAQTAEITVDASRQVPARGDTVQLTRFLGRTVLYPAGTLTTAGLTIVVISGLFFLIFAVMHLVEWIQRVRAGKRGT